MNGHGDGDRCTVAAFVKSCFRCGRMSNGPIVAKQTTQKNNQPTQTDGTGNRISDIHVAWVGTLHWSEPGAATTAEPVVLGAVWVSRHS